MGKGVNILLNNPRLWFLLKLLLLTAALFVIFGYVLPWVGLPWLLVAVALFFAILIWALWTLRQIAGSDGDDDDG